MRIISLNAYQGVVFDPLMAFINEQAPTTDLFCFQEMMGAPRTTVPCNADGCRVDLFEEASKALPDFTAHIAPMQDDFETDPNIHGPSWMGIATFVRKTIPVVDEGHFFICNERNSFVGDKKYETLGHASLFVTLEVNGKRLTHFGVHGVSEPGHKLDTPERLAQSRAVLDRAKQTGGNVVITGDFNLLPEAESVKMFAANGFRDLIKEYGITTTRGIMNHTLHPQYDHPPYTRQEFADYTFVSPGVTVNAFKVPDAQISDHLPMILECSF